MPGLILLYVLMFALMYSSHGSPRFQKQFPWLKLATSLCFVAIASYSAFLGSSRELYFRMLPAFLLAALGDLLLGLARNKQDFRGREFLAGACAFSAAHVIFFLSLCTLVPAMPWDFLIPLALMAAVFLLSKRKRMHLGRMKFPGIFYAFFVGLLFSKALMVNVFAEVSAQNILLLIGSGLFLASDLDLLFLNFHEAPPKPLLFVNLSTYYAGMALLGLSLYPF